MVNAIARPTVDRREALPALGVGRINFGPHLARAVAEMASGIPRRWVPGQA
ncbi:MAG: hypothetical protein H0V07_07635 [Propionibacteriales bacterium]|nr:hypothetical protein [Propionibacteriales bacterium]